MKRIDEKIEEIKKKDRQNRSLYMVIVGLILIFMAAVLYFQNEISKRDVRIDDQKIQNSKLYLKLEAEKKIIEDQKNELEASLNPEEYWNYVTNENTVEDYINFITNEFGIDTKAYIPNAIDKLKLTNSDKPEGFEGWIFSGLKNNAGEYSNGRSNGEKIIEIYYRLDSESNIAHSEPQIGDIVRLVGIANSTTYNRSDRVNNSSYTNNEGFRMKTRAIVVDVKEDPRTNNSNFYIKIKYY